MKKILLKHTIAIEEESLAKGLKSVSKYFKQLAKKEKEYEKKYKYVRKIAQGEIQIVIKANEQ